MEKTLQSRLRQVMAKFSRMVDDDERDEAAISSTASIGFSSIPWAMYLLFPSTSATLAACALFCIVGLLTSLGSSLHGAIFYWSERKLRWKYQRNCGFIGLTISLAMVAQLTWTIYRAAVA